MIIILKKQYIITQIFIIGFLVNVYSQEIKTNVSVVTGLYNLSEFHKSINNPEYNYKKIMLNYGLTFNYPITKKVALKSGLILTNRYCDVKYNEIVRDPSSNYDSIISKNGYFHYINIPIHIYYSVFLKEKFHIYICIGFDFEKFSGISDKNITYINSGKKYTSFDYTDFNPFGWLYFTTGSSISYNLFEHLSFKVEPQVCFNIDYLFQKNINKIQVLQTMIQVGIVFK